LIHTSQLVVVYNLLLQQKREKQKLYEIEKQKLLQEQKEAKKLVEVEIQEKPRNTPMSLSLSVGNSPAPKKQKGKKPIVITAKGEATPEKPQKKKEFGPQFQKVSSIPHGQSCGYFNATKVEFVEQKW